MKGLGSSEHRSVFLAQIILSVFLLGIFTSCYPYSTVPTYTPYPPGKWLTDFLTNPVCLPPCWENIIPGKTDFSEALTTIKNRSDVTSIKEFIVNNDYSDIQWDFREDKVGGWIPSSLDGRKVLRITFHVESLPLNKVLQRYGDPNLLIIRTTEQTDLIDNLVVFLDYKMILEIPFKTKNNIYQIEPGTRIFRISLVTEDYIKQEIKRYTASDTPMVLEWKGYGPYSIPQKR